MSYLRIAVKERKILLSFAAGSLVFFMATLVFVEFEATKRFDLAISSFFLELWGGSADKFFLTATFFGNYLPFTVLILMFCYLLILRGRIFLAAGLTLVLVEVGVLVAIFKTVVGRLRPEHTLYDISGFSFPSGHSALAAAVAVSFILVIIDTVQDYRRKFFLISTVFLCALTVIFSRIYFNVHWFTDVLGGIFLGIFAATLIMAVLGNTTDR